jgi:hypothetical protein
MCTERKRLMWRLAGWQHRELSVHKGELESHQRIGLILRHHPTFTRTSREFSFLGPDHKVLRDVDLPLSRVCLIGSTCSPCHCLLMLKGLKRAGLPRGGNYDTSFAVI